MTYLRGRAGSGDPATILGDGVAELVERLPPARARHLAPLWCEARQGADGQARATLFGAERHEGDDLLVPGARKPSTGRRRDAPAVRVGEVDREDDPRRPLGLAGDAGDVVHRAIGTTLGDEDLAARTRVELGGSNADQFRPPPLLQVLRPCEDIEDPLARRVEYSLDHDLAGTHVFRHAIPCVHVASPSRAVP